MKVLITYRKNISKLLYLKYKDYVLINLIICLKVAMGTGITSHYFNLEVIVPTARILGTEEYHVGKGSTINLICVIENVSYNL